MKHGKVVDANFADSLSVRRIFASDVEIIVVFAAGWIASRGDVTDTVIGGLIVLAIAALARISWQRARRKARTEPNVHFFSGEWCELDTGIPSTVAFRGIKVKARESVTI